MLSVLEPCTLIRVQTWDIREASPAGLEQLLGLTWPRRTGTTASARADVLCVGPAEWLVIAARPNPPLGVHDLAAVVAATAFRATDLSSALTRIRIEGPDSSLVLAKGCCLDLHPQVFPPGRVTRTRLAGMPVVVHRTAPSVFECTVARSYGEYLLAWLTNAVAERS